jgi:hypothetical protein
MITDSKFVIQASQYEFPYHYLPHFSANGTPRLHRYLAWGLDYLTYTSFVVEQIRQISPRSLLDIGCGDGRLINVVKTFVPQVSGLIFPNKPSLLRGHSIPT